MKDYAYELVKSALVETEEELDSVRTALADVNAVLKSKSEEAKSLARRDTILVSKAEAYRNLLRDIEKHPNPRYYR